MTRIDVFEPPTCDLLLRQRAALEALHLKEVSVRLDSRVFYLPWSPEAPVGRDRLLHLARPAAGHQPVADHKPLGLSL